MEFEETVPDLYKKSVESVDVFKFQNMGQSATLKIAKKGNPGVTNFLVGMQGSYML